MSTGGQENMQWLVALSKQLGRILPALSDMPKLIDHLRPIWEAFWMLSGSRSAGFGLGPIPLRDILTYLEWQDIVSKDEQERWVHYLKAMDNEFLQIANKKE
jgi:hypothetical protein